uniref:Lipocalin n=1 Tax=Rhipicephalus zambeziensis TaxID=60191 RepID=A0A224YE93_9ACAR
MVIFFAGFVVCNVVVQVAKGANSCSDSSEIDGWTFFSQSSRFDMLQRNYNHSGRTNNSMCVNIGRNNSDVEEHTVIKNFTYRNLSSKFDKWATALIKLQFYTDILEYDEYDNSDETSTAAISEQTYKYAKSTIICTASGFSLSPPSWTFLYVNENCSVIALSHFIDDCRSSTEPLPEYNSGQDDYDTATHKFCLKPRCELWVRRNNNESQHRAGELSDSHCCEQFFNKTCAVSTLVRVYDPKICLR